MDKTTLVTGGTGLIGYNIIQSLLRRKRKVKALVRSIEKGRKLLPATVELIEGDILNMPSLEIAMEGCQIVYHTAGWPEQWFRDTALFQQVNVVGTQNMIEVALNHSIEKFIYTSTIDVFQGTKGQLFNEKIIDPYPKHTYYERSKQDAFHLVLAAAKKGLNAISVHPAGLYGPGPTASPGMNNFFIDLKAGKIPMLLPGGLPLVFSEDAGEGHVLAEEEGSLGESYILSESYFELKALAQLFFDAIGSHKKPPPVMPLPVVKAVSFIGEHLARITNKAPLIPKGQMEFLLWGAIPDSFKAQTELGWEPSPIKEGIVKTIDFLFK